MKAARTRKNQIAYDRYKANLGPDDPCQFCVIESGDDQFVSSTKHFKIIHNRFPYDRWDDHKVSEHLMVVPRKHTDTLRELSFDESREYIELISDYEHDGYNIYARTPGSKSKSVVHQHTHLIKFVPKTKSKVFVIGSRLLTKPVSFSK